MPAEANARGSPYVQLEALAAGGMGRVDLCLKRAGRFQRLYAVKRLHPHLADDEDMRTMFVDEARVAGLVRHANVVSVLDFGEDEEGPYFVMDYVEGLSLSRFLEHHARTDEPVPVTVAAAIVSQIARGLHAAHELVDEDGRPLELIHRDVSPQNVLIGLDGLVRVTDFGIVKAFGRSTRTSTGVLKGKIGYMSPEQLRFEEVDRRSDLFALGVILAELVTGERLYTAEQTDRVARRILDEPPPDLGLERMEVPPAVVELGFRLLAKHPDDRPATAAEVADRLDDIVLDEGPVDLAQYVEARFGAELRERRDQLRELVTATPTTPPRTQPRRVWMVAAVLLIAVPVAVARWARTRGAAAQHQEAPPAPFRITAFSADWSTPNAIHWVWEVDGEARDFHAYELRVASSPEALASGEGVLVFDRAVNPELGRFTLDDTRDVDRVLSTVTDGLQPMTEYHAQLVVLDTAGGRTTSPNIAVNTTSPRPEHERVVFSEEEPDAELWPTCWNYSARRPFEGQYHLELQARCGQPNELSCGRPTRIECFDFLRFSDMWIDLGEGLSAGEFTDAYLEFALAIDASSVITGDPGHAWWTQVRLYPADGLTWSHHPGPVFRADGEYRRYQIPLTEFRLDNLALGEALTEVHIGSMWTQGSVVRLDEVRLYW